MLEFFKRLKLSFLAASVLYIVLGAVLLFWPDATLNVLCWLLGGALLAYGAVAVVSYLIRDSGIDVLGVELLLGVAAAALGVLFLFHPAFIPSIVPTVVGVYIAIDSLVNLRRAITLAHMEYQRWWVVLLLSLLGVALGVVILMNPFKTQMLLFQVIGGVFAYLGLSDLWALFKLSRLAREARRNGPIEVDPIDIE